MCIRDSDGLGDPSSAADPPLVVHPPQALHELVHRCVEGGELVVETSLRPDHGSLCVARDLDLLGPTGDPLVGDDDVVTTGATLAEAARALRAVGSGAVIGAAMAATQRTRA